jgi:hypothetical protein
MSWPMLSFLNNLGPGHFDLRGNRALLIIANHTYAPLLHISLCNLTDIDCVVSVEEL